MRSLMSFANSLRNLNANILKLDTISVLHMANQDCAKLYKAQKYYVQDFSL